MSFDLHKSPSYYTPPTQPSSHLFTLKHPQLAKTKAKPQELKLGSARGSLLSEDGPRDGCAVLCARDPQKQGASLKAGVLCVGSQGLRTGLPGCCRMVTTATTWRRVSTCPSQARGSKGKAQPGDGPGLDLPACWEDCTPDLSLVSAIPRMPRDKNQVQHFLMAVGNLSCG